MARKEPYSLIFDPEVKQHLQAIEAKYRPLIREKIDEQLLFEPDTVTRNRKPLKQPATFEAAWELRFGPANRFRVFYEIDPDNREVHVLAVGVKERGRLVIGGEEMEL